MVIKKARCCYCGKEISISVPNRNTEVNGCSCNDCVPEDSSARNGIDESLYTEQPIAYQLREAKKRIVALMAQKTMKD